MASEAYRRTMPDRSSDDDVSRQILSVFMRHRIAATGTLQRNYFFEVRDGDFQRGINKASRNRCTPTRPDLTAIRARSAHAGPSSWPVRTR
jgi:hypothetical protein